MKLQKWMPATFKRYGNAKSPVPQGCPTCGFKGITWDSRPRDGYLWRRHVCKKRHTWTSIEIVVEDTGSGKSSHAQALKAMKAEAVMSIIGVLKEQLK